MQPKCSNGNSHRGLNISTVTVNTLDKYTALKVHMILPSLLLQKPNHNSKAKDHTKKLEERLSTWKGGRIMDLV